MTTRYLTVSVYRCPQGDCTNNGISGRFSRLFIACPDGPGSFDAEKEIPLNFCMVRRRELYSVYSSFGSTEHVEIVPATVNEAGEIVPRPGWWMKGGNIVDDPDSRFHALTGIYYPVCVYDRQEKH